MVNPEDRNAAPEGDLGEDLGEFAEVAGGRCEHFLAHALPPLLAIAGEVAHHRRDPLGVGQLVLVDVADRTDDAPAHLGLAELDGFEEIAGPVGEIKSEVFLPVEGLLF